MISDFQLALIGIVAMIIAVVIVYNRWQERKYRQQAERAFASSHADVLLEGGARARVEPQFGNWPAPDENDAHSHPHPSSEGHAYTGLPSLSTDSTTGIHSEIDCTVLVLAQALISADHYAPVVQATQALGKTVIWEGLTDGRWTLIDTSDDVPFRELRAGMQLADRQGPTDADTLATFLETIQHFAETVEAISQREGVESARQRALAVDALCADTDIEIAVNVTGRNGVTFIPARVRELAELNGMIRLGSDEYAQRDENGRTLFTLRNIDPAQPPGIAPQAGYLSGITFALDVPRILRPVAAFERMFDSVLVFADALQGEVVDDNRKPLTASGKKIIADAIAQIVSQMEAKGVAPGSAAALRLYR